MRIYVAGPYSQGDVAQHVRRAMDAGTTLLARGHAPLVPHLNHFWHEHEPQSERTWLDLDLAWLQVADAVLRLPGPSVGADAECAAARALGIPVYHAIDEVPTTITRLFDHARCDRHPALEREV